MDAQANPREPVARLVGAQADAPLDRLLALECELLADAAAGEVGERRRRDLEHSRLTLVAIAGGLEEADGPAHFSVLSDVEDAVDAQVVEGRRTLLGVCGRIDDPERRRRCVLGRGRRVGVERVALVEERFDERLERLLHH